MRIISGKYGGRRFQPPAKMPHTRPTTDIAKGGLFNTLNNLLDFEDLKTLDLFGGTGSISYELVSRGATDLTLVEQDAKMYDYIRQNIKLLEETSTMKVVKKEVFKFLENCSQQYDFIFAGPPYALTSIDDLPLRIFEKELLRKDGIFVLEHTPRNQYEDHPNFFKIKNYGTTVFSFFQSSEP